MVDAANKLKIANRDWILVCDGKKALILENAGDGEYPNLRLRTAWSHPDLATRDLGSDAPGRTFQSLGASRSAMETPDWHDEAERTFLGKVVDELVSANSERKFKGLVVIAPPRALSIIRKATPPRLSSLIKAEIRHDFTHLPVHEIESRLFG